MGKELAVTEPAAAERLAAVLASVRFCVPSIPVYTNVDVAPVRTAAVSRDALVRQAASPVRWEEEVLRMTDDGIEAIVGFGPGRVLAGLVRSIRKAACVVSVQDVAGPGAALHALGS